DEGAGSSEGRDGVRSDLGRDSAASGLDSDDAVAESGLVSAESSPADFSAEQIGGEESATLDEAFPPSPEVVSGRGSGDGQRLDEVSSGSGSDGDAGSGGAVSDGGSDGDQEFSGDAAGGVRGGRRYSVA